MTKLAKACALSLSALLATSAAPQGHAAPIAKFSIAEKAQSDAAPVYWRGRPWGWGWGPRWGWGPGPAVVGGMIIGGALIATAIAEHRASQSAMRRCEEDFPSFDPRSGTFRNRYGERRVCPYRY